MTLRKHVTRQEHRGRPFDDTEERGSTCTSIHNSILTKMIKDMQENHWPSYSKAIQHYQEAWTKSGPQSVIREAQEELEFMYYKYGGVYGQNFMNLSQVVYAIHRDSKKINDPELLKKYLDRTYMIMRACWQELQFLTDSSFKIDYIVEIKPNVKNTKPADIKTAEVVKQDKEIEIEQKEG